MLTYNISSPVMENFYFQTMVSDVVNDQWRKVLISLCYFYRSQLTNHITGVRVLPQDNS